MAENNLNAIIPKLLSKSNNYTQGIKQRIRVHGIFNEFDQKANTQLRNFINESRKRYKGIKSGNHLETVLQNSRDKYSTFGERILTDNFYVKMNIEKEKKIMRKKTDTKNIKEVYDLMKKVRYLTNTLPFRERKEIEKEEKNKISPNVSFYVLTLLFKYIKNENFLNSLTLILFSKKIHFKLIEQCQNPPKNLSNYESDWNNAIKPKKYKFKDHVMLNFTENFAKALLSNLTSPFSDVSSLIRKIENKFKNQTGTLNANSPEVYKSILEELYHIFSNREMEVMHTYHSAISKATGIQTGLSYKDDHLWKEIKTNLETFISVHHLYDEPKVYWLYWSIRLICRVYT